MAFTTRVKETLNRLLAPLHLRLDSLTEADLERRRVEALGRAGQFRRPVLPELPGFAEHPAAILEEVARHGERFRTFRDPAGNDVGYGYDNDFFSSPDAEVLYAAVRLLRPARIVEVGSGHSTKLMTQAIRDGGLGTHVTSIDPHPRQEIDALVQQVVRAPVEHLPDRGVFGALRRDDILFIDSSHRVVVGSDVVFLLLDVLPSLAPGVVVHVHDVFLPYEYPEEWMADHRASWNEQYLVHAILGSGSYEVLWAGHHLQRTSPDFASWFPECRGRRAGSLWLRKR